MNEISEAAQRAALDRLDAALRDYDVIEVLRALHESGVLAGLSRRVQSRWPTIKNEQDYHQIVAQAVDRLAEAVGNRERVGDPVAYLWRVAQRRAADEFRRRGQEESTDPKVMKGRIIPPMPADPRQAVGAARQLLPRVRGDNARATMTMILDAIEQGREQMPAAEIAETLGVDENYARQLRIRAFERLGRLAAEEGLAGRGFMLTELWDDEEELLVEPDADDLEDE